MSEPTEFLELPVLPLKNIVLFPRLVLPLSVGRDASRAAVERAIKDHEGELVLIAQRSSETETPGPADLYNFGTRAKIRKVLRTSPALIEIVVAGMERVGVVSLDASGEYMVAKVMPMPLTANHSTEEKALQTALFELAAQAIERINPQAAEQISSLLASADDPQQIMWLLATAFHLDMDKLQSLLAAGSLQEALQLAVQHIAEEIRVLEVRQKIVSEARRR